uniref:FolB domain-containing protein n=1 Tax=Ascaris lumbricoides TaxID=6252 RepID=A0A0M3I081_ASCLU
MCQVADFRVKISDSSPDKVTRADEIEHSEYEIRDLWHTTCGLQADDEIKANVLAYMKWTQEFLTSLHPEISQRPAYQTVLRVAQFRLAPKLGSPITNIRYAMWDISVHARDARTLGISIDSMLVTPESSVLLEWPSQSVSNSNSLWAEGLVI